MNDATDAADAHAPVVDPLTGEVTTVLPTTAVGTGGSGGYVSYGSYGHDGRCSCRRLHAQHAAPTPDTHRFDHPARGHRFHRGRRAGDAIDWWDVPVLGVVVASVIALATGLASAPSSTGAWFFVPFVLLLAAAAGALVVAEPSLDGGVGERTNRPSTVVDAERVHDLAMGELTLDLVDVPLDPDRPRAGGRPMWASVVCT